MFTKVKTASEIKNMRISGQMLAQVLHLLKQETRAKMSTKDLANLAAAELKKLGGKPAFLGFDGFPDVLCVSLNDEVVHGIPKKNRVINQGDVVSVDFGVNYNKMITDAAISFVVGKASPDNKKLVEVTEQSLHAGIGVVKNGVKTGDIGYAIEKVLNARHYGIVRDLVGHGVGHHLHEEPNIPNYGFPGSGVSLNRGMTIAIEPMATLGTKSVYVANDGWTIKTVDGSMAAHFEHTVLIGEDKAEILTAYNWLDES
jgi:methionyl aminopeptidase